MGRKRLSKRKAGGKEASPSLSHRTAISTRWENFSLTASRALNFVAETSGKIIYHATYRMALFFPGASFRTQRRNAEAFASKCEDIVLGNVPLFFALLINLAVIGIFATLTIHERYDPRADTMSATIGKILEDSPEEGKPPAGSPTVSQATTAQVIATTTTTLPLPTLPIITTTSPATANFQMPISAASADASLAAERAGALGQAMSDAQRNIFAGRGGGHQIGAMRVKAFKLCVILDDSPSMATVTNESIQTAEKIARTSGGEVHRYAGCAIRDGSLYPSDSKGDSFLDILKKLVSRYGVDAIYWVCDLQDEQNPEAIAEVKKFLNEKRVRLYISSYDSAPSTDLMDLIRSSGGEFEKKSLIDK